MNIKIKKTVHILKDTGVYLSKVKTLCGRHFPNYFPTTDRSVTCKTCIKLEAKKQ